MRAKILFVDDEINILRSAQRLFRDEEVTVTTASSADEAREILASETVAVLVSDNRMPGTSGISLLSSVRGLYPDTVRVLMTAYVDVPTAVEAINTGEVFRFIVKPWNDEVLVRTVMEGISRHQILVSLRTGDDRILHSIAQAIELKDPYTRGHCERVARYAEGIAALRGFPPQVIAEIRYGSWLHDCGKIGVPEPVLNSTEELTKIEMQTIRKHPEWGAQVARQAKFPERVVNIIRFHHERYDGTGYPTGLAGEKIPVEARIVAVADVFDALTTDRPYRKRFELPQALRILESLRGTQLDPEVIPLLADAQAVA